MMIEFEDAIHEQDENDYDFCQGTKSDDDASNESS
jgi:hypothetical protein